jgi:hypothetical protein
MRRVTTLLVLIVVTASCSGSGDVDTTVADTAREPGAAVQQWIDALAAGRADEALAVVEPAGLAVVIAVENSLNPDQLATLLTDGVPADLNASYWSSFVESFATFRGMTLSSVTVGETTPFDVEGVPVAAVTIHAGDGSGEVITRGADDGTWRVDMAATVGPGLASAVADDLPAGLEGDGGDAIATAYETAVVPGLSAALTRDPSNRALVFDIEYIVQLLAQHPLPATQG